MKIIVTHSYDAARYIDCGWKLADSKVVYLKGIRKKYMECTVIWERNSDPIFPEGVAPDIVFLESPDLHFK